MSFCLCLSMCSMDVHTQRLAFKTLHVEESAFLVGVTAEIEPLMLVLPFPSGLLSISFPVQLLLSQFFLPIPLSPSPYHHSFTPCHHCHPPSHRSPTHSLITHSSLSLLLFHHSHPPSLSSITRTPSHHSLITLSLTHSLITLTLPTSHHSPTHPLITHSLITFILPPSSSSPSHSYPPFHPIPTDL